MVEKEDELEHTHDDGTTHSHEGGDKEHTHEKQETPEEEDMGEEVELEAPAEDKFTNDLDPTEK